MTKFRAILSLLFIGLSTSSYSQDNKIDPEQIEKERIRWNQSLTQDTAYKFNKNPNAFLMESVRGKKPGMALDLGMGQGRNTIFLAKQGWTVTGVDIADQAIAFAKERAKAENVKINTEQIPMQKFDYGVNRWGLIVHVYEGCLEKTDVDKILKSLKPGGMFVFEFFHREAGIEMNRPDFGCMTNTVKETIERAGGFKILQYSEEIAIADYSLRKCKVVKLLAVKK
jgi:2-polyprenyl-3-methyl-5-hydroxy-6-metoxy-1,4-benzoquinol methylase